jgi:hypothetical protein
MGVSGEGHNEEASRSPVDKKNLVDMLENDSKIRRPEVTQENLSQIQKTNCGNN